MHLIMHDALHEHRLVAWMLHDGEVAGLSRFVPNQLSTSTTAQNSMTGHTSCASAGG